MHYTLNCNGQLLSLETPRVMAILNVTPDSFYSASRRQSEGDVRKRVSQMLAEGADIIDVGACSTRPGATMATQQEETERLRWALAAVRSEAPDATVSIDTFRADVARMAVEEYGANIINDAGSPTDTDLCFSAMARMVARLRVPYIYTSHKSNVSDILTDCARAVEELRSLGQHDIIVDPGFGFGKTLDENHVLMDNLDRMRVLQLPVLVGISRKSMITKLLGITTEQALNATTCLNTVALLKGADILRVHDVPEAVQCIRLVNHCKNT